MKSIWIIIFVLDGFFRVFPVSQEGITLSFQTKEECLNRLSLMDYGECREIVFYDEVPIMVEF